MQALACALHHHSKIDDALDMGVHMLSLLWHDRVCWASCC